MHDRASSGVVRRALRNGLVTAAIVATLLLVPAGLTPGGTWIWGRGIAFIAGYVAIVVGGDLAVGLYRPEHLRTRQQGVVAAKDRRQPALDAIGSVALLVLASAWLAFIPVDDFRLHLLPQPPSWARWAGAATAAFGAALSPMAVWENRFATPNIQDQTDRGQQGVATGVYRLIRHPIYLGNLLLLSGTSLWLGSTAALVSVVVLLAMTLGRIRLEEQDLRARLPPYADYARRVPWRLIPFIY